MQRWLNRDPLEEAGGINLYGFVNNSPISLTDPFGLSYGNPVPPCAPYPECVGGKTPPSLPGPCPPKRDCDLEALNCRSRGVVVCAIVTGRLGPVAGMICGITYNYACEGDKRTCRQENAKNGY